MTFDREELLEEYEDDTEILQRMVEIFDRDCGQRLSKLRAAVQSADWETLMSEAHALKGGLGNFFATESFETAQQLESLGKSGGSSEAAATLARLESQLQDFRREIGTLIGE